MSSSSDTRDQTVLCAISETQWFVSWTISCSKKEVKKMWNTAYEMVTPVSSSCLHSSKLCSCAAASAIQHLPSMDRDWMTPHTTPDTKTSATSAATTSTTSLCWVYFLVHLHYTAYAQVPMHNVTDSAHPR